MVQMTAEDLRGSNGGQVRRVRRVDVTTVGRHQRIAPGRHPDDVAVEQNSSIFQDSSDSHLMSNDCLTLQTAAFQSCYFRKSHQEAKMSESFERVRVLWPDHLGLARGKYVPASLAQNGSHHRTGTSALGSDRGVTPEEGGRYWSGGLPA